MILAWLLYILALAAALAVAWSWFPKSPYWRWTLGLIGLMLLVPWRAHPDADAGLAPAIMITLFSAAFDSETALASGRAIGYWVLSFLVASGLWQIALRWWQYVRARSAGKTTPTE